MKQRITLLFVVVFALNHIYASTPFLKKIVSNPSEAVLLVFYRPDCPYCARMDQQVSQSPTIQSIIELQFNLKTVDISTPEGKSMAAVYAVTGVPSVLKLDTYGNAIQTMTGFESVQTLESFLKDTENSIIISQKTTVSQNDCGNSQIDFPEQCDDGNINNGDGCNSSCIIESGWSCQNSGSNCIQTDIPEIAKPLLTLTPNPTRGLVTINGNDMLSGKFVIYDITGRKLMSESIENGSLNMSNTVDLNNFNSGEYIFIFTHNDNSKPQTVSKIIKL